MPIQDELLKVRTVADGHLLVATPFTKAMTLNATALKGLAIALKASSATGTTPSVKVTVFHSDTAPATESDPIIASKSLIQPSTQAIIPFSTQKKAVLIKIEAVGTSADFTTVEAWLTENFGQDYNRSVKFA